MGLMRFRLFLSLAVIAIFAASCGQLFDIYLVNPCETSLEIETLDRPVEDVRHDSEPSLQLTLPPESITLARAAFSDALGGHEWALRLRDSGQVIAVDGATLLHDTFLIPTRFCEKENGVGVITLTPTEAGSGS
jgi:hypothetical protein